MERRCADAHIFASASASLRPHHCRANSKTFQDLALRFPDHSRTKLIFQDFPSTGNFTNTIPGGVGARLSDGSRLRRQHQCCDRRSIDALLLPCVLFVVAVHTDSCRQLLTDCGEQWYPLVNTTALQHLVTPSRSAPTVTTSTTRYSMDSERPQHCCPLASNFEYITHNAGTSQYISLKALLHEVDFDPPPPQLILCPQGQMESTS